MKDETTNTNSLQNNKKTQNVTIGSTLSEIFRELNLKMEYGPLSVKVNNKVEGLHYRVYHNKDIEYLDITSSSGARAYTRTLFLVLCKAVHDLWPGSEVVIDIPVSNGYYCNLNIGRPITQFDAEAVKQRMQKIIDDAIPIRRYESTTEEVVDMFNELGMKSKVKLLKSVGRLYTTYYDLDGYKDYYYGTLLTNTRQLYLFGLENTMTDCCCASPRATIRRNWASWYARTRCSTYSRNTTTGKRFSAYLPSATSTRLYRKACRPT